MALRTILRIFPHSCPGFRCAVCWWVRDRYMLRDGTHADRRPQEASWPK